MRVLRPPILAALLVLALVVLAMLRGLDHDESQYVAAARLTAAGLIPYRDYAYLQTPLQPFAFAPLAWAFGGWTWPAMRAANALLGALTVVAAWRAMREAGVGERTASACAALFAACDVLLFSAGTARNDALPAALLACALVPILRAERGAGSRWAAMLVGLLLSGAAAAKLSYALPAAAYALHALVDRRHRPMLVALGAVPAVALVGWSYAASPAGFLFGVFTFPTAAPAEYYAATGRMWKLSGWATVLDTLKFLSLGPALIAIVAVARRRVRPGVLEWLALAGLLAALLPTPTWRQYLLPMLPPLFVLLAIRWQAQPPTRTWRIAAGGFACIGLVPSLAALGGAGMGTAIREVDALAEAQIDGPVATLSPQFLPRDATLDARFATGPFYFRGRGLLPRERETALQLVSRDTLEAAFEARPPQAIVVGGEGAWTSGDASLDRRLEDWALRNGWRRIVTRGRLRAYLRP